MYVTVANLITKARAYVDDQHAADKSWIPDPTWEYWLTVEYHTVIQRLISDGLVGPRFVEETVSADGSESYDLDTRVMAIAAVYEVDTVGNRLRELRPLQIQDGRFSLDHDQVDAADSAYGWLADATYGATGPTQSNVTLSLRPTPSGGTYVVRILPEPPSLVRELSGADGTVNPVANAPVEAIAVNLPAPAVDLIVLGAANRALIKEGSASAALYGLIKRTEDDLAHMSNGRILGGSPVVRNTDRKWGRAVGLDRNPSGWWWV